MEIEIIDGSNIPRMGFGTFQITGEECIRSVEDAIAIGYRHIDTARAYGNETEVGKAIKNSGVSREELFLTTKIWRDELHPERIPRAISSSLKNLQTDYVDLCLIHWPVEDVPVADTLGAMEKEKQKGNIRHLGVSNFTTRHLQQVEQSGVRTITNQVEYHAMLDQSKVMNKLREMDMSLSAYSPLARGRLIDHPVLQRIGEKYGKLPSQVALRWLLDQQSIWVLPKTKSHERRVTNFEVFDFHLDEEDHEKIRAMYKNVRVISPEFAPEWD